MNLSELVGQPHAVGCLMRALQSGRIGHAYLFAGPRGVGKRTAALAFARALNCESPAGPGVSCGKCRPCEEIEKGIYPDLLMLGPEDEDGERGYSFHTETISVAAGWAALTAHTRRTKVCILEDVHLMTPAAANHFLKMLEEPPPRTVWLLLTSEPGFLLPTIRSRCQPVRFVLLPRGAVAEIYRRQGREGGDEAAALGLGRVDLDPAEVGEAVKRATEAIGYAQKFDMAALSGSMSAIRKDRVERLGGLLDGIELACADRLRHAVGTDPVRAADSDTWIAALDAVARARWRLRHYMDRTMLDSLGADLALALGEKTGG